MAEDGDHACIAALFSSRFVLQRFGELHGAGSRTLHFVIKKANVRTIT